MKNYNKNKIKKDLDELVSWLWIYHSINVDFSADNDDEFCQETETIFINSKTNYRAQLNVLLHEIGHFFLIKNKKKYSKIFPFYKRDSRSSKGIRIDTLREEIYAWDKGIEIAKKLNIKIDKRAYFNYMKDALWTYVKWAYKINYKKSFPRRKKK